MSVPVGDSSPSACVAAEERALRKVRRSIGERQLRASSFLLCGMRALVERQLQVSLSQRQTVRREEAVLEIDTFRQMCSEMQKVTRQQTDLECLEHLHHCRNAIRQVLEVAAQTSDGKTLELVEAATEEQLLQLCVLLCRAIGAMMRRRLSLTEVCGVGRQKIVELLPMVGLLVSGIEELTSHPDLRGISNAAGDLPSFSDVKLVALLKSKRSLRDVKATTSDFLPSVCQTLMDTMQVLMRRTMSLAAQQGLTSKETLKMRRQAEIFMQTFEQLIELTHHNAIIEHEHNRDIENETVGCESSASGPLQSKKFLTDMEAKGENFPPIVCHSLMDVMQALMKKKVLPTGQQEVMISKEAISKVRREAETFAHTFQQLIELTSLHGDYECKRDIGNDTVAHGSSLLQETAAMAAQTEAISTAVCDGTTSADLRAAAPVAGKRILRDVEAKLEDSQPVTCHTLLGALQALMRRKISATEQVLTGREMLKMKRQAETFAQTYDQVIELACRGAVIECNEDTENEAVGHGSSTSGSLMVREVMATQTEAVRTATCKVSSSAAVRVAAPLKCRRFSKDVRVRIEDPRPSLISALISTIHSLMRRRRSMAAGHVLTEEEMLRVRIETETLRQMVQQLRGLTNTHAVTQSEIGNCGKGDESVPFLAKTEVMSTQIAGTAVTAVTVSSSHLPAVVVTTVSDWNYGVSAAVSADADNHWKLLGGTVASGTSSETNDQDMKLSTADTLQDACRQPTNDELRCLARLIEPQWKEVAHCLRPHPFESHHISNIEYAHPQSLTDQSAVILKQWCRKHGKEATIQLLCESLLDAECRLPAEKVFGEQLVDRVAVDMKELHRKVPESVERKLFELAKSVGTEWRQLALQLDISSVDMDCIDRDIPTTREKAFQMLRGWYWKHGSQANLDVVHAKLLNIRIEKQAEKEARAIFPNNLREDRRFYGRERELDVMKECLLGPDVHLAYVSPALSFHLLVVRGHGGIGKSSLAFQFAVMFKDVYQDGVFLLNSESWPTLHMSVRENIAKLIVPSQGGSLDQDNNLFLNILGQKSKVLLLYDNADDLDHITHVLPRGASQLHVIVTTRCAADHELLRRADRVVTLGYLSPDNAVVALFGWADRQLPDDGDELEYAKRMVTSSLIQGLPIAIAHIGTFAQLENMSFCDYYKLLMSQEEELTAAALDIDKLLRYFQISHLRGQLEAVRVRRPYQLQTLPPDMIDYVSDNPFDKQVIRLAQFWMNKSNHVYLTWQFDIDAVNKKSPDAMCVLKYAALLASRNIPGHILESMAFPDSGRRAALRFSKSIIELSAHTLITTIETNDTYRSDVHALVQSAVFQWLIRQPDDLHLKLTRLAGYFLQHMPIGQRSISISMNSSGFLELIPHIYSVAEKILMTNCQNIECCDLVENACWTALEAHHVNVACYLNKKQLEMVEASCSNSRNAGNAKRHLTALLQMGQLCLVLQQKPSVAQSYYTKALQLIEGVGDDTKLLLQREYKVALGAMDRCYQLQHKFSDAAHFHHQLSLLKSSPSSEQRDALAAMNNLALRHQKAGQFHHAIGLYQQALHRAQHTAGTDILVSRMMTNLGQCLIAVDDYVGAAGILEQSLAIKRQLRAGDHVDVANALRCLSQCYQFSGDLPKATQRAEEALSTIRATHDPHHPQVAIYIAQLAACCCAGGDADKAIRLSQQSVDILRSNQPGSREDLCDTLSNLGWCYQTKNMLREAIFTLKESLALRQSFLPRLHPDVAKGLSDLGLVYEKIGDLHRAMKLYRESLSIREHILPVHIDTATVLNSLIFCLFQQGQITECLQLCLRARDILCQVFPVSRLMTEVLYYLGRCYDTKNKLREAISTLEECFTLQQSVFPKLHFNVATTLSHLGSVYHKAGDVHKATDLFRESLSIREHILPVHTDTADVLNSLSGCLFQQGQVTECLQLWLRSRDILTQVSPVSEQMGTVCLNLGVCYMQLSRLREAEEAVNESVKIRKAVWPTGHPLITKAEEFLHQVLQKMYGYW